MTDRERLQTLARCGNECCYGIFECALDNAGFDGVHLEYLSDEQCAEVIYGARFIVDGRGMPSYRNEVDWQLADRILNR